MAGKRKSASKLRPRSKRSRRSVPASLPSLGVMSLRLLRNMTAYPKTISSGKPASNWLDKLSAFGAFALKMFLAAISYDSLGATSYPTGSIQCFCIGVEDLLWSSAIRESVRFKWDNVDFDKPCIDYRQGRLRRLTVRVTPSSELAKRGGRLTLALVPVTLTEAVALGDKSYNLESISFEYLMQMPGAVTVPASRPVSKTWTPKPADYGFGFKTIGQMTAPSKEKPSVNGGDPVCFVYLGYQDMASSNAEIKELYSPEVASFNVDLSGEVALREFGRSYIRETCQNLMNAESVAVSLPGSRDRISVPASSIEDHPNGGFVVPHSYVPRSFAVRYGKGSLWDEFHPPVSPFEELTLE